MEEETHGGAIQGSTVGDLLKESMDESCSLIGLMELNSNFS